MSVEMILSEAVQGCIKNVLQMAMIIIPLMIFIEVFQDLHLLDRMTAFLTPLTRLFGLPREGNLPLLAGLLFGISYGAGIIISSAQDGELSLDDIFIINLFLIICHSLLEDTLLFAAIGAKWLPILLTRLMMAILVCTLYARIVRRNLMPVSSKDRMRGLLPFGSRNE